MNEKLNVASLVSIKAPNEYSNWVLLNDKKQLFELKPAVTDSAYIELCNRFKHLYNNFDEFIKKLDSDQPDYETKIRCCFAGIVVPYAIWNKMTFPQMESVLGLARGMQLIVIIVRN